MALALIGIVFGVIVFFVIALNVSNKSGYRSQEERGYHPRERGGEREHVPHSHPPEYQRFTSSCLMIVIALIVVALLFVALVVVWSLSRSGGL
jgi:hypothetical protein